MKTKNSIRTIALIMIAVSMIVTISCKHDDPIETGIVGFQFFNKIPGLWHGPVSSATPAGNFDDWYLDFRPVSEAQISQFSLLDTNTINNISFFVVKFDDQLKLAMRTEGCFKNQCCVTYEVMDSANDGAGYYRFSDFVKGTQRAYTEFTFTGNQMLMKVYTSKFNTVSPVQLHSTYTATLGTRNNITEAVARFGYPKPNMVKDFSTSFAGMTESIFFNFDNDPYSSVTQPYVGMATAHITIDTALAIVPTDEVFLLFTTEPLFTGSVYHPQNLKYISKYVFLTVNTASYTIRNIHPGTYYIYSLIDKNHDGQYLSGDYMSSLFTNSFTVLEHGDVDVNTEIDLVIP